LRSGGATQRHRRAGLGLFYSGAGATHMTSCVSAFIPGNPREGKLWTL
jgi:hypothetical protein